MTTIAFVAAMAPLLLSSGIGSGFNKATASIVVGGHYPLPPWAPTQLRRQNTTGGEDCRGDLGGRPSRAALPVSQLGERARSRASASSLSVALGGTSSSASRSGSIT